MTTKQQNLYPGYLQNVGILDAELWIPLSKKNMTTKQQICIQFINNLSLCPNYLQNCCCFIHNLFVSSLGNKKL